MNARHRALRPGGFANPLPRILLVECLLMLSAAPASAQIVPRATSVAAAPAAGGENWPSREVVFLDRLFHPRRDGSGERNPEAIPPTQTEIRPYGSILRGLKPGMSPKTVVALQFAEKGRRLLQG